MIEFRSESLPDLRPPAWGPGFRCNAVCRQPTVNRLDTVFSGGVFMSGDCESIVTRDVKDD